MTVLFSPVGTADPFTTLGEGPMLQIVRHYSPDKVVLFLSPKMAEYEELDGRYSRSIRDLSADLDRPVPAISVLRSTNASVHHFDDYIAEFGEALRGLASERPSEAICVNVTSGTPGMQQALVALGSFGELNLDMVQVVSPNHDLNHPHDREDPDGFDYETLWEIVRELEAGRPSRCREIETPHFADQLMRRNIETLISRYDYEAAFALAEGSPAISGRAKEMIEAAGCRLNLLQQKPARVFAGTELSYKSNDKLLEYLNVMNVRLRQGRWGEFAKCLTPPLTEILTQYVARKTSLSTFAKRDRKNALIFDFDAVEQNRLGDVFSQKYKTYQTSKNEGKAKRGIVYVYNSDLLKLAAHLYSEGIDSRLEELRVFEENVRNGLAHMMEGIDRSAIEQRGGLSLETVMAYLFELHDMLAMTNVKSAPDLYDRINEAIVAEIRSPQ